jgi:hypothetical protein
MHLDLSIYFSEFQRLALKEEIPKDALFSMLFQKKKCWSGWSEQEDGEEDVCM